MPPQKFALCCVPKTDQSDLPLVSTRVHVVMMKVKSQTCLIDRRRLQEREDQETRLEGFEPYPVWFPIHLPLGL